MANVPEKVDPEERKRFEDAVRERVVKPHAEREKKRMYITLPDLIDEIERAGWRR